jgi:hypothetical protein
MKNLKKDELLTDQELASHNKNKDFQRNEEIKDAVHTTVKWGILAVTPISIAAILFLIVYFTLKGEMDVLSGLALNMVTFIAGVIAAKFGQKE